MRLTQVITLASGVFLAGCATDQALFSGPHPVSYQEVMQETLHDAMVSKKKQVATFGEYHISARPMAQTSPDCWTIRQVIRKYDLIDSEKNVSVCHKDGKFSTTISHAAPLSPVSY